MTLPLQKPYIFITEVFLLKKKHRDFNMKNDQETGTNMIWPEIFVTISFTLKVTN